MVLLSTGAILKVWKGFCFGKDFLFKIILTGCLNVHVYNFHFILASSQTGTGGLQSNYCGGFLNDNRTGTTDAKIKGTDIKL